MAAWVLSSNVSDFDKSNGNMRISCCTAVGQLPFTLSSSSFLRAERMSLQFCFASEYTNASPIPEDAPVTQTTFDVSDDMLCRFF
jgi:hypothetical protein